MVLVTTETSTTANAAASAGALDSVKGRIVDLDSHLQLPMAGLAPFFGEVAGRIGQRRARFGMRTTQKILAGDAVRLERQEEPDEENVWLVKSHQAYGANDARERLHAMDLMGIDRQLIFPMVAVARAAWSPGEQGLHAMRSYNDHVIEWASADRRRLRPAAVVPFTDLETTLAETRRVLDKGCRAVFVPNGTPPAGVSPADESLDPFWAMLAEAGAPAVLHVGGNAAFLDGTWTPTTLAASPLPGNPGEASGPFEISTSHLAAQTFLSAMLLGGVFERHADLAVGAIELGAQWVGPMAALLDQRVELFGKRMAKLLSLTPSEYLNRQFRVTPGFFEPVADYIEIYGLEDVYTFSSDFPHPEGGTRPIPEFHSRIERLGPAMVEKLFVTNGELLLPDP